MMPDMFIPKTIKFVKKVYNMIIFLCYSSHYVNDKYDIIKYRLFVSIIYSYKSAYLCLDYI